MRVALVHNFHGDDVPSGENEVVEAEAAALRRAGVEVAVAAVRNDDLARRPLNGVQAAATVTTGIGISPLRLLDGFTPDVIHVHSLFPYLGRRWLRQTEVPVVTTVHSYRALCANGYLYRDGRVCTLCADGKPWSGVRYGCYRSRLATVPLAWANRRGPSKDALLDTACKVLVLSERARGLMAGAGVPAAKLVVDHHFVPDADRRAPDCLSADCLSAEPGRDDAGRDDAWLFVGRLTPEKGIDRLVAEWPDDVALRVIGDGPLRGMVESAAATKRIELLACRPRSEVLAEMERSFGLVFPSRWYETFGLVYIEALAAGLPTLAFRPTVVADAVERDGTGVVASWGAVADAVATGRERFDGLRSRCRATFADSYGEAAFVTRRMELYRELAG